MKKISKTNPPRELVVWIRENEGLDQSYRALSGSTAHAALKRQLLEEQGFLCAYTGLRISGDTSHLEHIKPQHRCEALEDVDYRNILACFPADGGDVSHGFGAPMKRGWWDEHLLVSPLANECQRRFKFSWSGHVSPSPSDSEAAIRTIEVLGLDAGGLVELRRRAILAFFGFESRTGSPSRPLSLDEAQRILDRIEKRDRYGNHTPFCFVLKQLLERYVKHGK